MKQRKTKYTLESIAGSIDALAIATAKGFEDVHKRFDGVDKRFDDMDTRFDHLEYHTNAQERRITNLEDKVQRISVKINLER